MPLTKALFMEGHVSKGGTCISSFVVVRKGRSILVGKMTNPSTWVEKFYVGPQFAEKYVASGKWVIPASHLKYGEHPKAAAERIAEEMVGLRASKQKLLGIQSHISGNPTNPDESHWDICFVYEVRSKGIIKRPDWFSALKFEDPKKLKPDDFTRGHGDVLQESNILR